MPTVAPVPTTMSLTLVVVGTGPAGTVTTGSVLSCASTPAGRIGKLATGEATTLGLLVQPLAVVGTGGIADDDAAGEAEAELTGDAPAADFFPLPCRLNSKTVPTMTITAPTDNHMAVRRRALTRACALAAIRRS